MTWNELRHLHKDPLVIAIWRRAFGPALRWLTPGRRRLLLGLAALPLLVERPWKEAAKTGELTGVPANLPGSILLVLLVFAFVCLCWLAAKRYATMPAFFRRHPQLCLHAVLWSLLGLLWGTMPADPTLRTLLAGCAIVLPFLVWRAGYMMFTAQRGKMPGTRFTDHLAYLSPLWRGSNTPYGKGLDYLCANEAKDEEALARSQLAGIKLLVLGTLWKLALEVMDGVVFGADNGWRRALGFSLDLPRANTMLADPRAHSVWLSWVVVYVELVRAVLYVSARGHLIIGYLRLFGFNVFRNSYKPLLAESIVEFWNRFYYYFKELLVNFFFFPTFTRYFKTQPRLRVFAAVFMAAFVGNIYYHLLDRQKDMVTGDFASMWSWVQMRACYCFLLATGICVSMLREQRRGRSGKARTWPRRALAIFGVWTFFGIIRIWAGTGSASVPARLDFCLGLLGLH